MLLYAIFRNWMSALFPFYVSVHLKQNLIVARSRQKNISENDCIFDIINSLESTLKHEKKLNDFVLHAALAITWSDTIHNNFILASYVLTIGHKID